MPSRAYDMQTKKSHVGSTTRSNTVLLQAILVHKY